MTRRGGGGLSPPPLVVEGRAGPPRLRTGCETSHGLVTGRRGRQPFSGASCPGSVPRGAGNRPGWLHQPPGLRDGASRAVLFRRRKSEVWVTRRGPYMTSSPAGLRTGGASTVSVAGPDHGRLRGPGVARPAGAPGVRDAAAARLAGGLPGGAGSHRPSDRPRPPHRAGRDVPVQFAAHPSAARAQRDHRRPGRRNPGHGRWSRLRCRRPLRPSPGRRRVGARRPHRGGPARGRSAGPAGARPPGDRRSAASGRPGVHAGRQVRHAAGAGHLPASRAARPRDARLQRRAARAHRRGHRPHRRLPDRRPVRRRGRRPHRLPRLDRRGPHGPPGPGALAVAVPGPAGGAAARLPRARRILAAGRAALVSLPDLTDAAREAAGRPGGPRPPGG